MSPVVLLETTTLRLEGATSPLVGGLILGGLLLILVLVYRRELAQVSRGRALSILGLRALVLVLLGILFLEPVLERSETEVRPEPSLLLVDRSQSFLRRDPRIEPSRARRLAHALGLLPSGTAEFEGEAEFPATEAERRAASELQELTRLERSRRLVLDDASPLPRRAREDLLRGAQFGEGLRELESGDPATWFEVETGDPRTDLAGALETFLDSADRRDVRTLIVMSDGRFEEGEALTAALRRLVESGRRLHAIGVGSAHEPLDLGIEEIRGPREHFVEDRLRGEIRIRARGLTRVETRLTLSRRESELTPEGAPHFTELWSQDLVLDASDTRAPVDVPFEIPPGELEPGRTRLRARLVPVSGEATLGNNEREILLTTLRRDLWILVIDGRPRWETRYLKNLFERDENAVLRRVVGGVDPGRERLERGDEGLPATRAELERFDVIILGDLPPESFTPEELQVFRDHVDRRGGGLIFLAGNRGHLASYAGTPLGPLLPVEPRSSLETGARPRFPIGLELTPEGREAAGVRFVDDRLVNAEMWELLAPLTWVENVGERAGAEVWVRTIQGSVPVIATRSVGRGRVLYVGTDETWRWRLRLGDRFHHRLWGQLLQHVRDEVFAAEGDGVALDTDAASYDVGESIRVRVRLEGASGEPRTGEGVRALVRAPDPETPVVEVPLTESEEEPGLYRGITQSLPPGWYTLEAVVEGEERPDPPLTLLFQVRPAPGTEASDLSWDERALTALALSGGGEYFREEDLGRLFERLESEVETVERRHRLEPGWTPGWLIVVVLLLVAEWILRKRSGLL